MLSTVILHDPRHQCWYEYRQPLQVMASQDHAEVAAMLAEVEQRVYAQGYYAAGFVSYGAAAGFDPALPLQAGSGLPLICFGLFAERRALERLPDPGAADAGDWRCGVTEAQHHQQVDDLRHHIAAGDVYQVNLTARLQQPGIKYLQDFARLAADAPYGAYVEAETFTLVSASPELFFDYRRGLITCRPMKGTVARGLDSGSDERAARWLARSGKNRAENLMITDMVRNDLGRIAQPGSVKVPALFNVEQYPTVWQMTSTVTARSEASVTDIFRALFPGASITGAPKRAAMALIDSTEDSAREIYTGSIGVIEPDGSARFNIAIRTAWSDKSANITWYGAGGGIVWDSDPSEEYQELLTKTRVLNTQPMAFKLLETLRLEADGSIFLLDEHLARLAASARYFDFVCDEAVVRAALVKQTCVADHPQRVRLMLDKKGAVDIQCMALPGGPEVQPLALAPIAIDSTNVYLYHKTTCRDVYQQAAAGVPDGCEALLYNQHGCITESAIANVVYQWQGRLYTPPVSDGLLPGTLRQCLLQQGRIEERSLHLYELAGVEAWYLINALRGWRTAQLKEEKHVQDLLVSGRPGGTGSVPIPG